MPAPSKQAIVGGIDARLAAYATLAGVALAGAAAAKADLIYSGAVNINIPSTTAGIYINLVTGVTGTSPGSVPGCTLTRGAPARLRCLRTIPRARAAASSQIGREGTSGTLIDNIAPIFFGLALFPIDELMELRTDQFHRNHRTNGIRPQQQSELHRLPVPERGNRPVQLRLGALFARVVLRRPAVYADRLPLRE